MSLNTDSRLSNYIKGYPSVSIIGMCKNSGKTTVLNRLIAESSQDNKITAVTSIGRDGETTDLVTRTKKPSIYIREGMLFATATGLLWQCDVTKEVLFTTGFFTPMGEVAVFRALSDGNVQLAGPSITEQLMKLIDIFYNLGAQHIWTDGAISRKTLCAPSICDAAILCTGASCHKDMSRVVRDTVGYAKILSLDESPEEYPTREKMYIFFEGQYMPVPEELSIEEFLQREPIKHTRHLYLNGALTNSFIKKLLMSGKIGQDIEITVQDAGKVMLSGELFDKFVHTGSRITVHRPVKLAAITVNPFSAYGYHFDKDEFLRQMQSLVNIPVINVEDLPDVEYRL